MNWLNWLNWLNQLNRLGRYRRKLIFEIELTLYLLLLFGSNGSKKMKIIHTFSLLIFSFIFYGQSAQNEIRIDSDIIFIQGQETLIEQLNQFKGKVIYVDFWATFCSPCIKQFKFKNELDDFFAENDIISLCICIDQEKNKKRWKELIDKNTAHGYHVFINTALIKEYKSGVEMSAKFFNLLGRGFPQFLIVDKSGNIVEEYAILPENKAELMDQLLKYVD